MTLFDIITLVKKQFPDTDGEDICRITNSLEEKIFNEIFSPCGLERPRRKLDVKANINETLFLDENHLSLYIYFIYAVLATRDMDFENSNAYSLLFNKQFEDLAISYRRSNPPVKNIKLKGGI